MKNLVERIRRELNMECTGLISKDQVHKLCDALDIYEKALKEISALITNANKARCDAIADIALEYAAELLKEG